MGEYLCQWQKEILQQEEDDQKEVAQEKEYEIHQEKVGWQEASEESEKAIFRQEIDPEKGREKITQKKGRQIEADEEGQEKSETEIVGAAKAVVLSKRLEFQGRRKRKPPILAVNLVPTL